MKKLILPVLFGAILSGGLFSGEATITGSASVSKPAEFVTVTLTVRSECHKKPGDARAENNLVTANVQALLKGHIPTEASGSMHTNGGHTSSFSKEIQRNREYVTICANTFQQTTTITFKTMNVNGFSQTFADIQEKVLGNFMKSSGGEGDTLEKAVTFVTIGTPHADVCETTKKNMSLEAAGKAADDAQEKFNAYARRCHIKGQVEVTNIVSKASMNEVPSMRYAKSSAAFESSADPIVETNFEAISIHDQVTVTYKYPQATFMCNI